MRLARATRCWYTGPVQNPSEHAGSRGNRFEATNWTMILDAGRGDQAPEQARAALARLCRTYWTPLYGFVRGQGHSLREAEALTHGFFAHLIAQHLHTHADRARGKFRTFLLAALRDYLDDGGHGGGNNPSLLPDEEIMAAETLFQNSVSPDGGSMVAEDRLFERQWAVTLLRTVLERLAAEYADEGQKPLFDALQVFLRGTVRPLPDEDELAARLGLPAASVQRQIATLRARYRAVLRAELRRTVDADREVDTELREFLQVLTTR